MQFSSPSFLFIFLPCVLLLFKAVRGTRAENIFLSGISIVFYAFGQLSALPLLLFSVLMNWTAGIVIDRQKSARGRTGALIAGVTANLLVLCIFKYLPCFKNTMPLGISVFTFQGISYIVDVYRKEAAVSFNFCKVLLYISFFPRIVSGPICKYKDIEKQLDSRGFSSENTASGIARFVIGFSKKMLISGAAAKIADYVFDLSMDGVPFDFRLAWLGAFAYAIQIYYDFSGYSDMAIGLSRIFGFRITENFNFPYAASSIREFWRRWHISLSLWFRDYLYFPLGGNRKGKLRTAVNRMLVFICTGIWHGSNPTFLVWGLCHGLLSNLEDIGVLPVEKMNRSKVGRVFCRLYTLLAVALLFVVFRSNTLSTAWNYLCSMFAFRTESDAVLVFAKLFSTSTLIALLIGILGSSWFMQKLFSEMKRKYTDSSDTIRSRSGIKTAVAAGIILMFILSLLCMANGDYSPFIYAQF